MTNTSNPAEIAKGQLLELAKRCDQLAKPDKGLRYSSSGYREGMFDRFTGKRLPGTFDPAKIEMHGDNADALYWIVSNADKLAAALRHSQEHSNDRP